MSHPEKSYAMPESRLISDVIRYWLCGWVCLMLGNSNCLSGEIDFNRDIRPLLSDRCFACHGPDAHTREAELRLDIREVAVALREGIQVIRPGDSGGSELVRRIMTSDKSDLMPPEDSGKSLSEEEKVILKEWIDQGAVYQEHWSFQPVSRVDIPEVAQESDEELSSIDRFLLSRLNSMGMGYSPEADPVTLIRRLSFDLLGLPPERGWVERYAKSQSFDVYVSLVDEILMSPHFGERLAVFWLDLVRYADTIGYHSDNHREVSGFRDYVIQSFNANKPFDQFTREQIAGDLLDDPDPWVRIASGYNRLLQTTEEGGAQAQEYRAIYAADRVRNVSSTWLGATLGCAQCHDHKYDPFSTKDFYSMAAFFDDIDEPAVGSQKPNFTIPDSDLQSQVNQVEVEAALAGSVVLDFGDCAVSQAVTLPPGMVELGQSGQEATGLGFLVSGDTFNFSSSADGLASAVNRMSRHGVSLKDGVRWKRQETEHGDGELTLFFCLNFKSNEGNRVGTISLHNERGEWVRKYPVNLEESGGRPIIFMLHVPSGEEEVELFCKSDGGIEPVLCGVGVHKGAYEVQKLGGIRFDIESMAQVDQEWGDSNTGLRYVPEMQAKADNGTTLQRLEDGSYLSSGKNPDKEVYRVWIPLAVGGESKPVYGIHLEALRHETMKQASLSRANGNFVMTGMEVWVGDGNDRRRLGIAKAEASFEQAGWPVRNTLDGRSDTGWAVQGWERFEDRQALFIFDEPLTVSSGIEVVMRFESVHAQHQIGRFRLGLVQVDRQRLADFAPVPDEVIRAILDWRQSDEADAGAILKVARYAADHSGHFAVSRRVVGDLRKRLEELRGKFRQTMVVNRVEPRVTRILRRGNWQDESGAVMVPAVPEFLPLGGLAGRVADGSRLTRVDLADWIMDAENPLTSRAMVNRLWRIFFGYGLSRNSDDLGGQGVPPTHPKLLDFLAAEFRDGGWNIKAMVREMVLSRAYRQSSAATEWMKINDVRNQLFARQTRFRLDAEFVRDVVLSTSGLLVSDVGGGNARPYQPAGYWQHLNFPRREYQADTGDGLYRRGLYTYWCRTFLHPSLLAFDAPSREECTAERSRSNTPQQSLVLLNDPTYVEAAKALAILMDQGSRSAEESIGKMFQRVLSRAPDAMENSLLVELYQSEIRRFGEAPMEARKLLGVGEFPVVTGSEAEEIRIASLTSVARAIYNLYEATARF